MTKKLGQLPVDFNHIEVEFGESFVRSVKAMDGAVQFPFLCDTTPYLSSGKPLKVAGIEIDENPSYSTITSVIHALAGLPRAYGNIQVIGGASDFKLDEIPNMDQLLKGLYENKDLPAAFVHARDIYRAANDLGANIITGGTQAGVMALISAIWLADQVLNEKIIKASCERARLLQINPWDIYRSQGPALIHFVPRSATIYPNNGEISKDNWPCPLAPCTAFISVKGSGGWGKEGETLEKSAYVTSFIPAYDLAVASLPRIDAQHSSRVAIIMNGGLLTILEAKRALTADYPATLITLNGTGRFADLLAAAINNDYQVPPEDHPVWGLPKIKADYSKGNYSVEFANILDHLKHNPEQAYVFQTGDKGLKSTISSILKGIPM